MKDRAMAIDAADMENRAGTFCDAKRDFERRLTFVERMAAEVGTLRVNSVLDPVPVSAATTYIGGRATIVQGSGYGQAICNVRGATYFIPTTEGLQKKAVPAKEGSPFAVSVRISAADSQDMQVSLNVDGFTAVGSSLGSGTRIATTGMVTLAANIERTVSLTGVVPPGTTTDVAALVQFTRDGSTYPTIGDSVRFREFLFTVGDDPQNPPLGGYFAGSSADSYWRGEPNKSPSVTALPHGSASGLASNTQAYRRDAIVDAGIKRRGGKIGTGGLAAVALRFDHHLPHFKSKILPLLKAYRLPWGQMLNSARIADGSETMTYGQIAAECYNSGGEVWNHGYSHVNMPDTTTADREVAQGFDDLTKGLPGLYIDGWAGPGQPVMMGMEGSETPERFWGTYPGRLVMARHAFVRGHYPGIYQPMFGPNLVGAPHVTIDRQDAVYVSGLVRGAVASGSGMTLMLHPNYLDAAGYLTTVQLGKILAELASLREAGRLLVLSPTAILLADASTGYRRNLLTTGSSGSTSRSWIETVSGRSAQAQYGVPHELVTTVRANTPGRVMLNLKETGTNPRFDSVDSADLTAGASATLRCLVTLPQDCAGITAQLTGDIDYSDIKLHAV